MGTTPSGGSKFPVTEKDVDLALRTIGLLFEPSEIIEIRGLTVGRTPEHAGVTYAGYFNRENEKTLRAAIRRLDGQAEGVYVVLNRFKPELLARAVNRLQAKLKNTTADTDITERRWLYIDCDPKRPAGISSTDEEHHAALRRIAQIRQFLTARGWPEPIEADSGNGGHLLYRLPPMDLVRAGQLVAACLKALAARFSDAVVDVDQATATAARICKLYGTMTRKGDATADRPHRRSRILDEPERIEAVLVEALEALAKEVEPARPLPTENHNSSKLGRFDIQDWLLKCGLEVVKGPEAYEGGLRWTLGTCPFNPEHEKPVIIQFPSGAVCYKCLHKSCAQNDWKALRQLIEPSYREAAETAAPAAVAPAADMPLITDLSQIPSVWNLEAHLNWCVEDMIAEGSVNLICAESGTGKTWLAYHLAGCLAHGRPILGRQVKQSKVLYLDGENPLYVVKQMTCLDFIYQT